MELALGAVAVTAIAVPTFAFLNSNRIQSVEIETAEGDFTKETRPRRKIASKDQLWAAPEPHLSTVFELITDGVQKRPNHPTLGKRQVVKIVEEEKEVTKVVGGVEKKEIKKWKYFELSGYEFLTYQEAYAKMLHIGSGLRQLGLKKGDIVTLFASTSREWMLFCNGCWTQDLTISTAYDTLGEEGLTFALNEGEVTTLFTNADLLPVMQKVIPKVSYIKHIVYHGTPADGIINNIKSAFPHINIYSIDDLIALGEKHPSQPTPPTKESTACIMYTSGSTGNPKGVELTHQNIVAGVTGAHGIGIFSKHNPKDDVYLAFLPLAHILELVVEIFAIWVGVTIGYGSVRTLTDSSVRNCKGDIRELRPTLMAGVPAVWEGIRKAVHAKLSTSSTLVRNMFYAAYELKWKCIELGLPTDFLDALVFNQIKAQTGGRLRLALSGGAPMARETQRFFTTCICTMIAGYGMTETVGLIAVQDISQPHLLGKVGPPCTSVEAKLVNVPDSKYAVTNTPPQGELWVRGANIMKGYYKQPELTAQTKTEDGWLMTGDIAEFSPEGNIVLIDRKKNLVKLSNGEYVALEKLESVYKMSHYVANICLYADPEQSFVVALVVPVEKECEKYAAANNLFPGQDHFDRNEIAGHPAIQKAVFDDLVDTAKKAKLKGADLIGACFVCHEEWTTENNMTTAAHKIRRADIVDHYKKDIARMYGTST
ncbi:uncharacterized protein BJ171DRAFT_212559 [Polychytrium aggregatum]|uniref:uncharacterized protein n=1 Tax=Polychytrium aggregatum TaxID=110093 RepID=UPI0022FE3391|nr:uncharacterized protein BJ171DRAFT_212559 [Polychytrium aggregatum]KAI9208720.1 hypothetical protein BJ171DRAFT_212559 [Polychytrium aggregatum]